MGKKGILLKKDSFSPHTTLKRQAAQIIRQPAYTKFILRFLKYFNWAYRITATGIFGSNSPESVGVCALPV